jgi:hypothetical protein
VGKASEPQSWLTDRQTEGGGRVQRSEEATSREFKKDQELTRVQERVYEREREREIMNVQRVHET